jgi:hypothetical protein
MKIKEKEFAVRALLELKDYQDKVNQLYKLKIDLIDFTNPTSLVEEALGLMFSNDKENYKYVLDNIQWWLYDDVDKIIYYGKDHKKEKSLKKVEDFVNYLWKEYKLKK